MAIKARLRKRKGQRGFTLVEVIVAALVLTIGIVGSLAAFATTIATLQQSREDSIARQEAQQFIEGIYAARNTGAVNFANLQSKTQDPVNGLFKDGMQPANQAGPDGMMNTGDDLAALEIGPDGKNLTLQRQILFTPINQNLRQITITIQYGGGNQARTYTEITYISTYR